MDDPTGTIAVPQVRFRLAALLTAASLVVAACAGGDEASTAETGRSSVATSGDANSDSSTTADQAAAVAGEDEPDPSAGESEPEAQTAPSADGIAAARSLLEPNVARATEVWPTDWTSSTIDLTELALGIPSFDPRDAIPPIYRPVFEDHDGASSWLVDQDPGVLVEIDGDARFYPLAIMTRHEIVNDEFGDVPVAVTYCPLCNTAVAFDRRLDGETVRFGVSGLLRHSDMVMWDSATTSLWQQVTGEGIVGQYAGTDLANVSAAIVSFADFSRRYPSGTYLSQESGNGRGYGANPYRFYSSGDGPIPNFFQGEPDPRRPALERVVGVEANGASTGYPFGDLSTVRVVNDEVGGEPIAVFWGGQTVDALDASSISDSRVVGTGIAFLRTVGDEILDFSANGDDTFVDSQTGTTWSLLGEALDGPLEGQSLQLAVHRNEFWFAWSRFFPDGALWAP